MIRKQLRRKQPTLRDVHDLLAETYRLMADRNLASGYRSESLSEFGRTGTVQAVGRLLTELGKVLLDSGE